MDMQSQGVGQGTGDAGVRGGAASKRNAQRVQRLYTQDYSAALYIAKMTAALSHSPSAASGQTFGENRRNKGNKGKR